MSTAIYTHADCLRHDMGDWHPESPARLRAIEDQLILARLDGLVERASAPLAARASRDTAASLAIVMGLPPCWGRHRAARAPDPAAVCRAAHGG